MAQSNDSATSLLGNATKNTNGSNLRQVSGPDGYTDSLKLLDQLLSGPPASDNNEEKNTEDVTLEGVDFEGLSLHDFVKEEPERVQQRQKSQFIVECQYSAMIKYVLKLIFSQMSKTRPGSTASMILYVLAMRSSTPWKPT